MKKLIGLFVVLFLAILINSCGVFSGVRVVEFTPIGEVGSLTTFTIKFSEALAPADKLDNWLDDEFIKFEPKIKGKFKWLDSKTLIFSPEVPLKPMQNYSANVTDAVLFNTGKSSNFDEYEFNTPMFDAKKVEFFWTMVPNQNHKMSVQANLYFTYPVDPKVLDKYLKLRINGDEFKKYTIITEENSDVIAINFGEIQQTDKEQSFFISVGKGMVSVIGKSGMEDTRVFEYDLPPISKMVVTEVTSGFDGSTGWIEVTTTQTVNEKRIKEFVFVNPINDLNFFVNENRFRIEGNFTGITEVELLIKKGLPSLFGGFLEDEYSQMVSLVDLVPSINFSDKTGKYLMLGGEKNIEVNAVNLSNVNVEVAQIFKNNILHFVTRYDYTYDQEFDYGYNEYFYVGELGKDIFKKEIKLKDSHNWLQKFSVNLNEALNQKFNGIYVVSVYSSEDRWIQDSKVVAMSDLGIIAKKAENEMMFFINSIATTEPISDAQIEIISTNNQVILTGKTGTDGVCKITGIIEKIKDFIPRLVIVTKGNDLNYIDLKETQIETSRFDVGGKRLPENSLTSFIYSDRNLYRPNEKANIVGIIRDDKINTVHDIPVIVKIISPTGKVTEEFKKDLDVQGSFEINYNIPAYALTGNYMVEVYTGSKILVGSYSFAVEEFVPDKIRVNIKTDKTKYKINDQIAHSVDAEFLFGSKASSLKYQYNLQFKHIPFKSEKYPDYNFANNSVQNNYFEGYNFEGELNDSGKTNFSFSIPNTFGGGGIIKGYTFFSVFDLTGRTVNRVATYDIIPNNYYLGILSKGYYYSSNSNINFKIVAVDGNDKDITNFPVTAKLIRYEWQTVLKKDYSDRFYYSSEKKAIVEWDKEILLNGGETNFSFATKNSGEYELRLSKSGEENSYIINSFYTYGWSNATATSFHVDKEGRIDIVTDKKNYAPGENAKILFTTPFSGKMLITFEKNGVYDYKYVEVKNKSYQLDIPIKDNFLPNVYITATLFKPHSISVETPFLVGHGFASIKVDKISNKLPITIFAPKKMKPKTVQEITIKTAAERDIYVTVSVVDEGILQIKNYITPDPYKSMYTKQALSVESYDLYKLLLPEILKITSSSGGDELAAQIGKRMNPIKNNRYKLISYWSGIKKTNSDGTVKVKINIPEYNGELRVMALAYSGNRFGSGETSIKVMDDLIIEPEIPRFLSANDSLISVVSLLNTTNKTGKVTLTVSTEGLIYVKSKKQFNVEIPPNGIKQVQVGFKADSKVGTAKIKFSTSGYANVIQNIDIAIRPLSSYYSEYGSGTIKAKDNIQINLPKNYLEGTENVQLVINKFPAIKFAKQLKGLVEYPYGCLEQTVSKLFPQLYFADIAKIIAPDLYKYNNPEYFIKTGIKKIESMQIYDGSISYWEQGDYQNWWATVYAAHFLVEAKKAGYAVNNNTFEKLMDYIGNMAKQKSTCNYITYGNNSKTVVKIANKEILYSLYVLALAGKGDISTSNYYKSHIHLVTKDGRYLLAGAFALMGKWNSYGELLPKQYFPEKTETLTGGNFDSEIRANAIILNVMLEVDKSNKQIPIMVKYLSSKMDKIYSTQESAFAFLALGKAARLKGNSDLKVQVMVNGKKLAEYNNSELTFSSSKLKNNQITLKAQGTGEVYYFWTKSGVKKSGKIKELDENIKVRRTYYSFVTKQEKSDKFKQGELIVCKIALSGGMQSVENIVISDLIPAGFEIENPRYSALAGANWSVPNPMKLQYFDVRDDRIILFTDILPGTTTEYSYLLRVVNKGKFGLAPISGECMYNGEYRSVNGAKTIYVLEM
ncbi:MAG: MG2 domain-containing protein [bacterium]